MRCATLGWARICNRVAVGGTGKPVAPERKCPHTRRPAVNTLKRTIENNDTRRGRAFDLGIQGLIVFSSVFASLWWSIVTLTTVGYGDVYPVTTGGRVFTFFVLLVGLGVVSVPAGLVASALSKAREMEE